MRSRVLMTAEVAALVQREVAGGAVTRRTRQHRCSAVVGDLGGGDLADLPRVGLQEPVPRVRVQTTGDASVVFDELREMGMRSPPAAE